MATARLKVVKLHQEARAACHCSLQAPGRLVLADTRWNMKPLLRLTHFLRDPFKPILSEMFSDAVWPTPRMRQVAGMQSLFQASDGRGAHTARKPFKPGKPSYCTKSRVLDSSNLRVVGVLLKSLGPNKEEEKVRGSSVFHLCFRGHRDISLSPWMSLGLLHTSAPELGLGVVRRILRNFGEWILWASGSIWALRC